MVLLNVMCTVVFEILENTDWINPKYDVPADTWVKVLKVVGKVQLSISALEIIALIIVFGRTFFLHAWYVFDLLIIVVAITVEVVGYASQKMEFVVWGHVLLALRGWKFFVLIMDVIQLKKSLEEERRKNSRLAELLLAAQAQVAAGGC